MPESPISSASLPAADYYRLIRSRIEHEDSLITQRLNWFLTSQSFLFTAYAIVTTNIAHGTHHSLQVLIPLLASITCTLIFLSIIASIISTNNLRRLYRECMDTIPPHFPPIQSLPWVRWMGLGAPILLPLLFLIVWIYLLTAYA